ncbi:MAG: hypothetical protein JXA23_08495 [Bacteroidales bacterium]|nr:hypothetical protein [Bacteroidales bacterium]
MITYLPHHKIDKSKWDQCIRESVNTLVYGFSWYLDLVSPGWAALVEEDYASVFPLTQKRKAGISYLAQPFFTQQLGLFTTAHLTQELVTRFLDAIPTKYKLVEIHLNSFNKVDPSRFEWTTRKNHELELVYPYDDISRRYSQNTTRNIRKAAEAGVKIQRKVSADELISLFRNNFGKREGKLTYRNYRVIEEIIAHSVNHASGILMGAGNREVEMDAGAFFLKDRTRFILLLAATGFQSRNNGAMFLLLDTFIREHAGQPVLLDFEGGNDPNLGRFYKSFGSREMTYPFVRISRIPFYKQIRRI